MVNKTYDRMPINELHELYLKAKFGVGLAMNKHNYYSIVDAYQRRRPIKFWYSVEPKPEDSDDEFGPWDGIIHNPKDFMACVKAGYENCSVHYAAAEYHRYIQAKWDEAAKKLVLTKQFPC